ncbi:MAG TPA: DUF4304 domain-containing protein [Gemmataceae bacterium]|jgi:hypothetical protein|nr:DUF4304 domain-containing protein [Gemmataceae bacterium]
MALDAWKKLVAAPVASFLKRRGFRKTDLVFSASRADVVLFVTLQSSTNSNQHSLEITCNLGIWVAQLARSPKPSVWDSHWRERIGIFRPQQQDYWWICTSEEIASKAGHEIAAILENEALPAMEALASPAALIALWFSGRSPGLTEQERIEYLVKLVGAD